MPSLIAKSPLAGQGAVTLGGLTLTEVQLDRMTALRPTRGQEKALAKALKTAKLSFPAPNRFTGTDDRLLVWTAQDQAFLIGALPEGLGGLAVLTDQSDGWARLRLDGAAAGDALMRLVPIDLRPQVFAVGHAARAPLNHMQAVLMRTAPDRIEVLVFRSMARTAWHEIHAVMQALAARAAAGV